MIWRTNPLLLLTLCLPASRLYAASRLYVDRDNGVMFSYPSTWLLNGDDDAATAKFRITLHAQPSAVIQFEGNFAEQGPYKGTDFESGAFTYVVLVGGTEARCYAALNQTAEESAKSTPTIRNGLRAHKLDATYTVAGTDDIHRALALFRNDRCYLFETVVIHTYSGGVAHPLDQARWRQIYAAFDAVLNSVRIVKPAAPPASN